MASLRKKSTSPYWFACIALPDGSRTQRSTKERDRQKAMKLALAWEEAAKKRMTSLQFQRVLSDIHKEIHGEQMNQHTIRTWAAEWLRRKGETGTRSAVTIAGYKSAVTDFLESLGTAADSPVHFVTTKQIEEWRNSCAARASRTTATHKLKIVKGLFIAARKAQLIVDDPAFCVENLEREQTVRRAFKLHELQAVLKVATDEWRGLILAGFYTGQRLKDLASLRWSNVDLSAGRVELTTSKTGRLQKIPLRPELRAYLEEAPAGDDPQAPVFPAAAKVIDGGRDVSRLSQQFHGILVAAGLAEPRPKWNGATAEGRGRRASRSRAALSFHSLRHAATECLKNAGVNPIVARDLIGHDSEAQHNKYGVEVWDDLKQDAIAKLPSL